MNSIEWKAIKIPFILFTSILLISILYKINFIDGNKGFCTLVNCNFFVSTGIRVLLVIAIVVFSILYCLEKQMLLTTFSLFVVSNIIFSMHESFGVSLRTGIIPLIFIAQFFAYFLKVKNPKFDIEQNRILYAIQVIVACYTLSAISKIVTSGSAWFKDAKYIVIQNIKNNQMDYFDGFFYQSSNTLDFKSSFILEHQGLIGIILLLALFVELFSFVALINKKCRVIWGIFLLIMHIGIFVVMEVAIFPFIFPMVLYLLNPFYLLLKKIPIFRPKRL